MSEKRAFDSNNNNNDQQQSNVTPHPTPLKKRFITGFKQQSSISPLTSFAPSSALNTSSPLNSPLTLQKQDNKDMNASEIDNIEHLSKAELLERMRSAKKNYLNVKDKVKNLDDEAVQKESLAGSIRLQLNLLRNEIVSTAKVIDPTIPNPTEVNVQNIQQLVLETENISQAIVKQIQAWFSNAEKLHLASDNQALIEFTQSETADLHKSHEVVSQSITQLRKDHDVKLQQINAISNDVWSMTKRLAETQEELDECIQNIAFSEKRFDRSQSTVVSEMLGNGKQEDISAPATPRDNNNNTPDHQFKEASAIDNQKMLLDECQFLLGIRERELIDVKQERYRLQSDVRRLDAQVAMISDDQILKSDYYSELYSSFDFYYNRHLYYEQKSKDLRRQLDKLKDERRMIIDQHNSEKSSQESILTAEMKRLKSDIERIKSQYHHFQQLHSDLMTMEEENKERNQSITNSADEQRIRMKELEQEILKKRQDNGSSAVEESKHYLQLKSQIDLAHGILHGLGQIEKGNISSKDVKETIQQLKANLDKLSFTNGSRQMGILDQLVKQTEKLTLMIDFFENTSDLLLSDQLNWDGGIAYERRKTKLESMIKDRTEQINKLKAEISKYAHTFGGLTEENNNIITKINASKRANQQQANHINGLEGNTKEKESLVIEKEVLIKKSEKDLENYRLEVGNISQELIELQTSLERNETQLLGLQRLAREKTKALDEEIELRKQVDDEYEKYQKKWALISQGENPASQQLINEVEELRAQFKCSTCKTRTRKCILLSCYHTFCNECIRTRLETRQRRCPSCALVFGASDVKEFYLYNTQ